MTDLRRKIDDILVDFGDDIHYLDSLGLSNLQYSIKIVEMRHRRMKEFLSLLSTEMMGVIPKQHNPDDAETLSLRDWVHGYNQALSDVKARLTELMGGGK